MHLQEDELDSIEGNICCGYNRTSASAPPVRCAKEAIQLGSLEEPGKGGKNRRYCEEHGLKYRLGRDNCPVCFDLVGETMEVPLKCGHWMHAKCLVGWNKTICPVCRAELTHNEKLIYSEDYSIAYQALKAYREFLGALSEELEHQTNPMEMASTVWGLFNDPIIDTVVDRMHTRNSERLERLKRAVYDVVIGKQFREITNRPEFRDIAY
jgi:hypothetical protein